MVKKSVIMRIRDLERIYGEGRARTRALKGVSFDIYKGEFVALSGPSGSGKSTAFHQISLLDKPTSGKIWINGISVLDLSDDDKTKFRLEQIGYVFQHYELLPELTAFENVCLPLMVSSLSYKEIKEKAEEVLKDMGLYDRKDHYPSEMSGGEQQRVSIARALVKSPKIILADEPTANLDSVSGKNVMKILQNLSRKKKITVFVINHERSFEKYFDRIIILKDGLLVDDGDKSL